MGSFALKICRVSLERTGRSKPNQMIYQASLNSLQRREVRVGDGAGRCWCSGPFVNGTWFAIVTVAFSGLWPFGTGSCPRNFKNFPILTFLSPKTWFREVLILLRQGNVSHSQEMINSLCSSVLASRCTQSTGPYRSYQVLSPAVTVTEEIAPRKTRRLCRWHDFTLCCGAKKCLLRFFAKSNSWLSHTQRIPNTLCLYSTRQCLSAMRVLSYCKAT